MLPKIEMGARPLSTLKVLYVDDDLDLRDVAEMSLQLDEAIVVQVAASGAAALALLDGGGFVPDVIMLDVMMPAMDGPAVLQALRARPAVADIPVIFITARTQPREVDAYRALGITGLITKPFDPLALAPEVRRIVAEAAG